MEPNPYESPHTTPIPPEKLSGGARAVRVGVTLFGIGVVVSVGSFVSFAILERHTNFEPQGLPRFWYQIVTVTAFALVPTGFLIAVIGGITWLWKKPRKKT